MITTGRRPWHSAGSTPAASNEVFPTPDGPDTTVTGRLSTRWTTSATTRSRPKKRSASSVRKAGKPRYGGLSLPAEHRWGRDSAAVSAAARHFAVHSSSSPPQAMA
nr:hypothetical protein [Lentzea flava]